jgi:hypothetical protein
MLVTKLMTDSVIKVILPVISVMRIGRRGKTAVAGTEARGA